MSAHVRVESSGIASGPAGLVTLLVGDPHDDVRRVEFHVSTSAGASVHPPDRSPAPGVFEKDLLLDMSAGTQVEPTVVLADGSTVQADAVLLPRLEPFHSARVLSYWNKVAVHVVPATFATWRAWVRRGAWPTADGTAGGVLLDEYLRYEGYRESFSFTTAGYHGPGSTWFVVLEAADAAGATSRLTDSVMLSSGENGHYLDTWCEPTDNVQRRALLACDDLRNYIAWLESMQVAGYIGEVGWSEEDAAHWNEVAAAWFAEANAAGLPVTVWAVGELWGPGYRLQPYKFVDGSWTPMPQAAVVEANPTTAAYWRGVNAAGAEFGTPVFEPTSTFSNQNRGTHPFQYRYNGAALYQYLFQRGVRVIRMPFRWERLQPVPGAAFDAAELALLKASVTDAQDAGLDVVLDVHNYGAYYLHDPATDQGVRYTIGTPQVTNEHFADLWHRLALEFNPFPGVIGYGLMNEPVDIEPVGGKTSVEMWEAAAQAAHAAILATGSTTTVMVGGYFWSHLYSHQTEHGWAFLGRENVLYEAHTYFDHDKSGRYQDRELMHRTAENFVRWQASGAMWQAERELEGGYVFQVTVYRLGSTEAVDTTPLWHKGIADGPVRPCTPGPGCTWRNYEYLIRVVDARDGSAFEHTATIAGYHEEEE